MKLGRILLSATLNGYDSCKEWLEKDVIGKVKAPDLSDGKKI